MQVHIRQGNVCPLSLQAQTWELPVLARVGGRYLSGEKYGRYFHRLQDAVALLYLAGGLVYLHLYPPMELAARCNLQLCFPIAGGTQIQSGSTLGVKVLHLLCELQGYLMQGHHALITRSAKARRQPQATLYVEPTILIPQHSFG